MHAVDTQRAAYTLTLRGPRVRYGPGTARTDLTAELDRLHARRVLLVATTRARTAHQDVLAPVDGRIAGHVPTVRRHVPAEDARAAASLARDIEADLLLSLGGGSATGTAKAVAVETGLPIVALPTTYAGSEMTPIYGITEDGVKRTARSDRALPTTVVLDPELTADLPPELARTSAVNALAHATSGVFAAGHSPLTDLLAAGATRLLADGLQRTARADLTQGAQLAGTVLAHAGSSAHHTACHILGGAFDLPHAETHAALLPHTLAFLQQDRPDRAAALGVPDVAAMVSTLLDDVGASVRLREIGLDQARLGLAAELLASGVPDLDQARAAALVKEAW
ncbi:maleylacetate reductase [Amycolatopsis sulphurea]|uniref:Maleylacetate reductase n=1 Tax=Amycolatopsis sulphurea TaxID=76022 RepID=A0A2A9FE28_9PSEU|nr:iron-containing alcohol dehydrogenase [Amycolatopsis sulphurea]PFG49193.1 maleylacetate reductase [Amycolatopsis sulphurea]